ncbi:putative multifunctional tRNA nucleotidyl transferase [Pseudomonas phage pPa_SNUABM_DT01]|nr:putative multifunctional tRNA nucleotidyl transferase [Pseudomonas phage pPa_SNUABM_DT01]
MEVFLVGGFVRDTLLGLSPNDRDYVVVGESPESMLAKGFTQVGGHFPVFLHPETQEEYALARQEVSTGDGYGDFTYNWDGVSLEMDLSRRDLTINAMAIDTNGEVVDLFGGVADLNARLLRHVGPAFVEDPLRIMRVARLSAVLGFDIAYETMALMKEMVAKGMLQALPGERVWKETEKALLSKEPSRYFKVLKECGALHVWFPELDLMDRVPQRPDYHAEGDVWVHTLMVLDESVPLTMHLDRERCLRVRYATLTHDFGKLGTPQKLLWADDGELLGKHHGHEDPDRFGPFLMAFSNRIKVPTRLRKFAHVVSVIHQNVHSIKKMSPKGLVSLFDKVGGNRSIRDDEYYLEDLSIACLADSLGRLITKEDGSLAQIPGYPQGQYFIDTMTLINNVDAGEIMQKELAKRWPVKKALESVRSARSKAVAPYVRSHKS